MHKMELLAPAGNLEKLKLAIDTGADAVYLGLQKFGLRSAAENFSTEELFEATSYAHQRNAKVFVVLNAYLHDKELSELPHSLNMMEEAKVDAVIVSDLGVVKTVIENSKIPVHLSTQASCLNPMAARLWKKMGVERIVLGREASLEDAKAIKAEVDIEIEMFIHGSMCMAYSGNCVISNYTQGRDSNRGGCAHSCRFEYSLDIPGAGTEKSFFMSSKDLNGLSRLEDFMEAGIDSLKVEGRMKNHLYVSTISAVYRKAIDLIEAGKSLKDELPSLQEELNKVAHRGYTEASLHKPAGSDSVYRDREKAENTHQVVGRVLETEDDKITFLSKAAIQTGDWVEIIPNAKNTSGFSAGSIMDIHGNSINKTKPNRIYVLPTNLDPHKISKAKILRKSL